ncbi:MAG: hypothetical protein J6V53_01595 [Alphaproteobacteria bacterium]|nr:hypothetical protein [Alphaproteobacteria bacterium]
MDKIIKKIEALNKLNDQAHNPKILWEEMKLVSDKAFKLQEEILELIQNAEEKETDISVLQQLFATREIVWDLIDAIAEQELFIKETTHTPQKKKCCNKKKKEEACECDDKNCCCKHKHG